MQRGTVLKIGGYSRISHSFSWGIFGHVTCLDQSRGSEKIWWIIICDRPSSITVFVFVSNHSLTTQVSDLVFPILVPRGHVPFDQHQDLGVRKSRASHQIWQIWLAENTKRKTLRMLWNRTYPQWWWFLVLNKRSATITHEKNIICWKTHLEENH